MSTLFSVEWWAEYLNDELGGMQRVAVVICFRKLSQYLPGGADVKVVSLLRRLVASQARFEAGPCGIFSEQSGSVTSVFRTLKFSHVCHSTKFRRSHVYAILLPSMRCRLRN